MAAAMDKAAGRGADEEVLAVLGEWLGFDEGLLPVGELRCRQTRGAGRAGRTAGLRRGATIPRRREELLGQDSWESMRG